MVRNLRKTNVFLRCLTIFAFGPFWHHLAHLDCVFADLGAGLGPSWPILGPPWPLLGLSWASLGPLLGLSWPIFSLSWASLGPSWAVLGSSSGQVGPSSPHLARILALSGASPGHVPLPWAVLAAFGAILAPFWAHFGPSRAKFGSLRSSFSSILKPTLRHLRSSFPFRIARPKEGAAVPRRRRLR